MDVYTLIPKLTACDLSIEVVVPLGIESKAINGVDENCRLLTAGKDSKTVVELVEQLAVFDLNSTVHIRYKNYLLDIDDVAVIQRDTPDGNILQAALIITPTKFFRPTLGHY